MWILREVKKVTDALLVHHYRPEGAAAKARAMVSLTDSQAMLWKLQLLGKTLHESEIEGEVG